MSSDEAPDCPLCMEPLELDDLNFYPCKCEYQICRFCWHRIRTDENGLCPACRAPYPEDPVNFKPLSAEELARIKSEKKAKAAQQRHKLSEGRKHLANLRVIQENLVYVMGLAPRIADNDILKRPEYFGKFGRILKVAVSPPSSNSQTSYTAYVTYSRPEEALKAIQAVNNVSVEGRTVKASLGTTKYCSAYLRNQPCHKTDCMYLHDLANPSASFTKEDMAAGKHTDYERKLHNDMLTSLTQQQHQKSAEAVPKASLVNGHGAPPSTTAAATTTTTTTTHKSSTKERKGGRGKKSGAGAGPTSSGGEDPSSSTPSSSTSSQPPSRGQKSRQAALPTVPAATTSASPPPNGLHAPERPYPQVRDVANDSGDDDMSRILAAISAQASSHTPSVYPKPETEAFSSLLPPQPVAATEMAVEPVPAAPDLGPPPGIFEEQRPLDWQAAFGLKPSSSQAGVAEGPDAHPFLPASLFDDDALGFDPFSEAGKGLADLMEEEDRHRRTSVSAPNKAPAPSAASASAAIPRPNGFGPSTGAAAPMAASRLGTSWGSQASSLGSISSLNPPPPPHNHRPGVVSPNTLMGSLAGKGPPLPLKPGSLPKSETASPGPPGPFATPPPGFPPMAPMDGASPSNHYPPPPPPPHPPNPNGMRFPGPPPGFPPPPPFREASPSQPHRGFGPPQPHPPPPPPVSNAQDSFNLQEWQDGLKNLLPNVNVHFAPGLGSANGGGGNGGGGKSWSGYARPPGPPQLSISTGMGGPPPQGAPPMRPSPPHEQQHQGGGPPPFRALPPPMNRGPPPGFPPPPPPPPTSSGWNCLTPPPPGFSPRQH